jgi:hypothetical protein
MISLCILPQLKSAVQCEGILVLRGLDSGSRLWRCGSCGHAGTPRVAQVHSIEHSREGCVINLLIPRLENIAAESRPRHRIAAGTMYGLDVGICVRVAANRAAAMVAGAQLTNHPSVTSPTSSLSPTLRAELARCPWLSANTYVAAN